MSSRVLITGVTGGSGRQLVKHLRQTSGDLVFGLARAPSTQLGLDGYEPCDLLDRSAVERAVSRFEPQVVFHLAALNSFYPPEEIERVNLPAFSNLMGALRRKVTRSPIRLVTIGSAAELGPVRAEDLPVDETTPCRPHSAYGRSKWAITERALAESADEGLQIIVARTFNLLGPGLDSRLAVPNFARQIRELGGGAGELRTGNLRMRRDFVDVRDAVAAYALLAAHGRAGQVYHVCSGRSYALGELLERLLAIGDAQIHIVEDPALVRAGDLPDIYSSHARLTADTLWQPRISIDASLADML